MFPSSDPDDQDVDRLAEFLSRADNTGVYFEDWLLSLEDITGRDTVRMRRLDLVRMAHYCGVRLAHGLLEQAWLEGIEFYLIHKNQPWFIKAIGLCESGHPDLAADIFIAQGIHYAYCCRGLQPGCPLHAQISARTRGRRN